MNYLPRNILKPYPIWVIILTIILSSIVGTVPSAQAQEEEEAGAVQRLTGQIDPTGRDLYNLPDLEAGDQLTVYVAGTTGNLDPFIGLADDTLNQETLGDEFVGLIRQVIAAGRDPLEALPEIADTFFLAWDDDSGSGYDAAFEFRVPEDGDYKLVVASTPTKQSFGTYDLLLGLNAPEVLEGEADPTGDLIAEFDEAESRRIAVQEKTDTLTTDRNSTFFVLEKLNAGETLYAFVEATGDDLRPILELRDFGSKLVRVANLSGQDTRATIEFPVPVDVENYRLVVRGCCEDEPTTGDFRLFVGLNEPNVLSGSPTSIGGTVLQEPTPVRVGIRMDQITGVDQRAENFGVVADIQMRWTDPALAFSPDSCQCAFKTFTASSFSSFATANDIQWPAFNLFNQQGRRDSQNQLYVIQPDGEAIYVERFSATLQAPDFDFSLFPFDRQQFFVRVISVFPQEFYVFSDLEGESGLGEQLGEEEWIVTEAETSVDTINNSSRFSLGFEASRHLTFYIFRIFVPVLVIIIVSWITFFLKDYGKRVDVAAGNLLLFIAFNFTISSELPRLGYLTFMDTILVSTFVVTALVVVFNVYLKRLEVNNQADRANHLDRYMIWVYPLAYITAFVVVTFLFT